MAKPNCSGRRILEDLFDGDLEAYAEHECNPRPPGVDSDPHHPWHQRKQIAKITVDQPDDCVLPRALDKLYTRQEVCEFFNVSDSGFGKWGVPARGKSGKYVLYSMSDVIYYKLARDYVRGFQKVGKGNKPPQNIHQIAASLVAETQNEFGPVQEWWPTDMQPAGQGASKDQLDLFTAGQ